MLAIVRGIPGSGKTTFVKKKLIPKGYKHFEADMHFERNGVYEFNPREIGAAHLECQRKVKACINKGEDVAVSNTFTTMKELRPYIEHAQLKGVKWRVYECSGKWGSIHDVPKHVIAAMKDRWQDLSDILEDEEGFDGITKV